MLFCFSYPVITFPETEFLQEEVSANSLDLLEIKAVNSLTNGAQSTYMFRDIYSDSGGFINTIDAANTNATFTSSSTNEAHAQDLASSTADTGFKGLKITIGANSQYLKSVTKHASATPTSAHLRDAAGNILSIATFSGNIATFQPYYILQAGAIYFLTCGSNGASYTSRYKASVGFPINLTTLSVTNGCNGAFAGSDVIGNITSIEVSTSPALNSYVNGGADKIIQTNAETLASNPAQFQIYTLGETITGTGSVTYDISFDNGAHYQTGITANTETAITNTGTELILKQNLNAGDSGGNAAAKGYAVMFW